MPKVIGPAFSPSSPKLKKIKIKKFALNISSV